MQVLKDEIRNSIHRSALAEFKEKGFRKSSMREIAKRAGITAGNLYRYFGSKEDLFYAVVSPAFGRIVKLIKENKEFDYAGDGKYSNHLEYAADRIAKIHGEFHNELLILIDGSRGTVYERAKEEVITMFEENIRHLLSKSWPEGVTGDRRFIAHVIAAGYIEGLVTIMRHYGNDTEAVDAMAVFTVFLFDKYARGLDCKGGY
jgi:AcrR family transcriptional regulator